MSDQFAHATNEQNIHKILRSGQLKPLDKIKGKVNVEPSLFSRGRATMDAADAQKEMDGVKNTDRVFLSKGGVVPSYGNYIILKELSHPQEHGRLNLIPNEYTTRRTLSVKHNARVFVPDEEVDTFRAKYPGIKIHPKSEMPVPELGPADAIRTLGHKLYRWATGEKAADWSTGALLGAGIGGAALGAAGGYALAQRPATPVESIPATLPNVKRLIGSKALHVGSSALGISTGKSDVDVLVPYKREKDWQKAYARLKSRFPELRDGEYSIDKPDKRVLTGKLNGQDIDIVLAHGDKPLRFAEQFRIAQQSLTPERAAEIRQEKERLRNSWIFPETRYKLYKKQVADELGLTPHYF